MATMRDSETKLVAEAAWIGKTVLDVQRLVVNVKVFVDLTKFNISALVMDSKNGKDCSESSTSSSSMSSRSSHKDLSEKSVSAPTVLFSWIWNWFATLPKTISNLYTDIKNGDLLARFTLLDAMLQFIVAVATSCHPQEEGMGGDFDEHKADSDKAKDSKVFGGTGRTLRSRTVAANS